MKKVLFSAIAIALTISIAYANKFSVGDTAYVCAGTIFGESNMCKTEVLDTNGEEIKVLYLTNCTSIMHKGDTEWTESKYAGTVKEVRNGQKCQ